MPTTIRRAFLFFTLICLAVIIRAQNCTNSWVPYPGSAALPGVDGYIAATCAWDPDGAGPIGEQVVAVGTFTRAGATTVNQVAVWDPATDSWSSLGTGLDGQLQDIVVDQNNDLVVVGTSVSGLGVPALVRRWDGITWQDISAGLLNHPRRVAALPNGDLVVSGWLALGSSPAALVRWDGVTWTDMGMDPSSTILDLEALPNGDLVVAGQFAQIGGVTVNNIARWDGQAWSSFGIGTDDIVWDVDVAPNGDLVIGGGFTLAGSVPASRVARWDGVAWSPVGLQWFAHEVRAVRAMQSGEIFAGGSFDPGAIRRWDGTSWTLIAEARTDGLLELSDGRLICTGLFEQIEPHHTVSKIAIWDGSAWSALGVTNAGPNDRCNCVLPLPDGRVVVGGEFDHVGLLDVGYVATWDGTAWAAMGDGFNDSVLDLALAPNGDVVAVGRFTHSGSLALDGVARWDGTSWAQVGPASGSFVNVLTVEVMPNGNVFVGGAFTSVGGVAANGVAMWNGTSWSPLGSGVSGAWGHHVECMVQLPNGDLVIGGGFAYAGGALVRNVARWDGASWHAMSGGLSGSALPLVLTSVFHLLALPSGEVVAAGNFDVPQQGIARWNGSWWASMGGVDQVRSMTSLPNGDVIALGDFQSAAGVPVDGIARWTGGSSWTPFGQGATGVARDAATSSSGEIFVVGDFTEVGGVLSPRIARMTTSCPATAATTGNACPSSTGTNSYVADNLPWLGSTFRATCEDLPPAIVGIVTGWATTSLPLSAILAVGEPGCELLVTPNLLDFAAVTNGTLQTELVIPDDPAMAGWNVYQQVVPIEVDASLNFVSMTSSNALHLTFGML